MLTEGEAGSAPAPTETLIPTETKSGRGVSRPPSAAVARGVGDGAADEAPVNVKMVASVDARWWSRTRLVVPVAETVQPAMASHTVGVVVSVKHVSPAAQAVP